MTTQLVHVTAARVWACHVSGTKGFLPPTSTANNSNLAYPQPMSQVAHFSPVRNPNPQPPVSGDQPEPYPNRAPVHDLRPSEDTHFCPNLGVRKQLQRGNPNPSTNGVGGQIVIICGSGIGCFLTCVSQKGNFFPSRASHSFTVHDKNKIFFSVGVNLIFEIIQ